jgi:hypothetical protein
MEKRIPKADYKKIGDISDLTVIFTSAVKARYTEENKLADLVNASTPEDKKEQYSHAGKVLKLGFQSLLPGKDSEQLTLQALLHGTKVQEVFARAALRIDTPERLATLIPEQMVQERYAKTFEKYDMDSLAGITRKALEIKNKPAPKGPAQN